MSMEHNTSSENLTVNYDEIINDMKHVREKMIKLQSRIHKSRPKNENSILNSSFQKIMDNLCREAELLKEMKSGIINLEALKSNQLKQDDLSRLIEPVETFTKIGVVGTSRSSLKVEIPLEDTTEVPPILDSISPIKLSLSKTTLAEDTEKNTSIDEVGTTKKKVFEIYPKTIFEKIDLNWTASIPDSESTLPYQKTGDKTEEHYARKMKEDKSKKVSENKSYDTVMVSLGDRNSEEAYRSLLEDLIIEEGSNSMNPKNSESDSLSMIKPSNKLSLQDLEDYSILDDKEVNTPPSLKTFKNKTAPSVTQNVQNLPVENNYFSILDSISRHEVSEGTVKKASSISVVLHSIDEFDYSNSSNSFISRRTNQDEGKVNDKSKIKLQPTKTVEQDMSMLDIISNLNSKEMKSVSRNPNRKPQEHSKLDQREAALLIEDILSSGYKKKPNVTNPTQSSTSIYPNPSETNKKGHGQKQPSQIDKILQGHDIKNSKLWQPEVKSNSSEVSRWLDKREGNFPKRRNSPRSKYVHLNEMLRNIMRKMIQLEKELGREEHHIKPLPKLNNTPTQDITTRMEGRKFLSKSTQVNLNQKEDSIVKKHAFRRDYKELKGTNSKSSEVTEIRFKRNPTTESNNYWKEKVDILLRILVDENFGKMNDLHRLLSKLKEPTITELKCHQNENGYWSTQANKLFAMLLVQKHCNPTVWSLITPNMEMKEALAHLTNKKRRHRCLCQC